MSTVCRGIELNSQPSKLNFSAEDHHLKPTLTIKFQNLKFTSTSIEISQLINEQN